jgi:DNA-binding NtrC family response regulator
MNQKRILICDDDALSRKTLELGLRDLGALTLTAHADEAMQVMAKKSFDLLILDIQMRTPDEGLVFLPKIRAMDPDLSIIVMSGLKDYKTVREAMKNGANDYLSKDFEAEELKLSVERALAKKDLHILHQQKNGELLHRHSRHPMVGDSVAIQKIKKLIEKFRNTSANILITGEMGSGKEIVARHLRKVLTNGSLEPFVAIDSATLHAQTAESLLFGHERGAFTGADSMKKGLFEEANGGVVFFDEIGNMPLAIQAKLLRVLQEKEITRLGSHRVIELEFRVIAATNRSLEEMVKKGDFLPDLLERIQTLPIHVPALKERKEDLPALVGHFLKRKSGGKASITEDALKVLQSYSWPGNVRELSAMLDYSIAMMEGFEIDVADLHPKLIEKSRDQYLSSSDGKSFYDQIEVHEKEILKKEYERFAGNISQMALGLKMDRSHLHAKLKLHGLHGKS